MKHVKRTLNVTKVNGLRLDDNTRQIYDTTYYEANGYIFKEITNAPEGTRIVSVLSQEESECTFTMPVELFMKQAFVSAAKEDFLGGIEE